MKFLILIGLLAVSCSASIAPVGVTIGLTEYSHPIQTLYHAQDSLGHYVYGYATPTSSKSETKTQDGVTHGGYSYIDADGHLQTVQYTADAIHGFRVAASNLPRDLPDVAHAKAAHLAQFNQIAAERTVKYSNPVAVPYDQVPQPVQDLPEVVKARAEHLAILNAAYSGHVNYASPQPVQDLPEVARARAEHLAIVEQTRARDLAASLSPVPEHFSGSVIPIQTNNLAQVAPQQVHQVYSYTPAVYQYQGPASSQYHAQDGLGQYSYGYVGPLSSKSEEKTADGVTRGGYSYIDAHGVLQTVNYIADAVHGFRVAATNLPVAPKTTLIGPAEPVVVQKAAPVVVQKAAPVAVAVGDGAQYAQEVWY